MKSIMPFYLFCLLTACGTNSQSEFSSSYIVETIVQVQPNKTGDVLQLFKSTNPKLVRNEPDWISASFSSIEEKDIVIVRAKWKAKTSYTKFSNSEKFKKTMKQFNPYFTSKPEVHISKVLFEM